MGKFDDFVNKTYGQVCEQATAPNPVSYGRTYPVHGVEDEDAESVGANMTFDQFLEKLISVLGSSDNVQHKLRLISKMAFNAKRHQEGDAEDSESEMDAEEGELMTHMKQSGMISKESKPGAIFSGTREKRK